MSYPGIILLIAGASSFAAGIILVFLGIRWILNFNAHPSGITTNIDLAKKGKMAIGIGIILSGFGILCLFWAIMFLSG